MAGKLPGIADVADPSDFPPSNEAPGLRDLDAAFRCTICGELFEAPVTIQCGHCFCSVCLRDAWAAKAEPECPACRVKCAEYQLRSVPVIEEIISAWKQSRPTVLQLLHTNAPSSSSTPQASSSESLTKKRKRSRSSSPDVQIVKSPSNTSESTSCPVCSAEVLIEHINFHLDSGCKKSHPGSTSNKKEERKNSQTAWSKLMTGVPDSPRKKGKNARGKERTPPDDDAPLPLVSYDTLKDRQVRELLDEQSLLATGDRSTMVARHKRWRTLFNANLDKSLKNRKARTELKRQLLDWEAEQRGRKDHTIKNEDMDDYKNKYKSEFDKLTAAARGTRKLPTGASGSNNNPLDADGAIVIEA